MTAPLTLYLLRHGEVHNPENILYGRLPNFRLSETGRDQAIAAGRYLAEAPLAAIYSSPMERAQETARLVLAQHRNNLELLSDERLNECLTPHQGSSTEELIKINFDLYTGNEPPYEHPRDLRRRLLHFIAEARAKHPNKSIAAVSHGDMVVMAFMFAKGQDENDVGRSHNQVNRIQSLGLPEVYPATASISKLVYQSDDPNEVPLYDYIRPY
jgi:broad specificity phosphatase PhoE